MVTTYKDWKVGDIINICASIDEFCGSYDQFIFAKDINVIKSPETCSLEFGTERGCGLHLNNVELTFRLVKISGSVEGKTCNPQYIYKTIGSGRTNSNGVTGISYTVTEQDRLDYIAAYESGYPYKIIVCITNSDGQSLASGQKSIVTDNITIIQNLCYGVICEDICIGNDLYYQICNPVDGKCDLGTLKETNSIICQSTHYIEYDFSFLPSSFTDFILSNIARLSNWLGTHLPAPSNIIYKKAIYENGKFRMYVKYAPPVESMANLAILYDYNPDRMSLYNRYNIDYRYNYMSPGIFDWITTGAQLLLDSYARIISAIILFLIAGQFAIEFGLGVGIVALVIAAVISYYIIKDIKVGTMTSGTTPEPTPADKVIIVEEFVDKYVDPAADDLTPQCKCPTPSATCTVSDMLFYIGGRATARYAQCIHAHENKGDISRLTAICTETIKIEIESIKNDLVNGTITVQQACTRLENNIVIVVKEEVKEVIRIIECDSGYAWNKDTQKCEKICNFPVMGYCLDTPLLIGGLLLGGYILYRKK